MAVVTRATETPGHRRLTVLLDVYLWDSVDRGPDSTTTSDSLNRVLISLSHRPPAEVRALFARHRPLAIAAAACSHVAARTHRVSAFVGMDLIFILTLAPIAITGDAIDTYTARSRLLGSRCLNCNYSLTGLLGTESLTLSRPRTVNCPECSMLNLVLPARRA